MFEGKGDIKFWQEFIEMYKENPCLWDSSCPDNNNQSKKNLAYGILVEKLWELDENADLDAVKKKIGSFRRAVRNEASKAKKYKNYVSKWCFLPMLSFLTSQGDKDDDAVEMGSDSLEVTDMSDDISDIPESSQSCLVSEDFVDLDNLDEQPQQPEKKRKLIEIPIEITSTDMRDVKKIDDCEDDSAAFAEQVRVRMSAFDPQQKCIAQKLISDVMFLAEIKQLQLGSHVVNRAPQ